MLQRICIVSLQRILWLQNWDTTDVVYSSTRGVYWTTLEPTLGVVNACLPVMRPALRKIFNKELSIWSKFHGTQVSPERRWFHGSARSASQKGGPEKNHFRRLSDPNYLLTDLEASQKPSATTFDIVSLNTADAPQKRFDEALSGDGIKVTRSWNVHAAMENGDQNIRDYRPSA